MRLICPNCHAQYDVSDDAIPPGGRDVQCSNCQLSWFQTEKPTVPGRETAKILAPSEADATSQEEPAEDAPVAEAKAAHEVEASETEAAQPKDATDERLAEPDTTPDAEPAAQPQRKPLDDAVASILREEAAVSTGATTAAATSAASAAAPISKPPATEAAKAPKPVTADETRQRIALMTAEEGGTQAGTKTQTAEGSATTSADEAHLRTVPSINEINATLRARAQANDTSGLTEAEKEEAVQRKGFRRGFFVVVILLVILILPYILADQITENMPQTTGIMSSYVAMVDQLRVSLNELIGRLTGG